MSDEEDSIEYMTFCKSSAQKSVTVLKNSSQSNKIPILYLHIKNYDKIR